MAVKVKLKPGKDGARIRETPVNGKPVGQVYEVDVLELIDDDGSTLQKLGQQGEWVRVQIPSGLIAYIAAWFLDRITEEDPPTEIALKAPQQSVTRIGLKPTANGIRLREKPVDGFALASVTKETILVSLESAEETQRKVGVQDQWLKVQTPTGLAAYTAAWLLEPYSGELPPVPQIPSASNITGMNLDIFNRLGKPEPARLQGMGWVRFGYNVSMAKGSEDINAAYNFYQPTLEKFARAGFKVLLVFTHQTYGEGKDEFFPWHTMTRDKWVKLTRRFVEMVKRIAAQYAGQNVVHAYQVWNEMDAPIGAVASVPMSPEDYAYLLGETIKAIKGVDPDAYVITGGHTSGPQNGANYARVTLSKLPDGVLPDGIAFHPYGRGVTTPQAPYAIFGHIREEMQAYLPLLPDKPIWITEWGVLDRPTDSPVEILEYAAEVTEYLRTYYPNKVAVLMWYAWAMGMHNGYGLVNQDDKIIDPLYNGFRKL